MPENKIEIFKNEQFGEIRTIEVDDKIYFCGKDAAIALGYTNPNKAINDHCKEDGVTIRSLIDSLGRNQDAKFITEGNVYRLITRSKLPAAEEFEKWLFDEVVPTIRKTGGYVANDDLFINTYLGNVSEDVQQMFRVTLSAIRCKDEIIAQEDVVIGEQRKEIEHKEDVIVGLVDDIDLATKRQRINQIVRHSVKDSTIMSKRWNLLYTEFEKKYHVNLSMRFDNYKDTYKPKLKNKIDVIERQMEMIPQLYEICCKLFENDVQELLKEWECTIAC